MSTPNQPIKRRKKDSKTQDIFAGETGARTQPIIQYGPSTLSRQHQAPKIKGERLNLNNQGGKRKRKTKRNKTKRNKTKRNKTKRNKTKKN